MTGCRRRHGSSLGPVLAALLFAACGTGAPSAPSTAPTLDPAAALAAMRFTCGGAPFPAAALTGPIGAEQADTPAAAALRAFLADPPVAGRPNHPRAGYRLLAASPRSAEFGAGLAYVRVALGPTEWALEEWGECRPRAVFEGLNGATWTLAGDAPFPTERSRSFTALVQETQCTGGLMADGRVLPPAILVGSAEVLLIFAVRPPPPPPPGTAVGCPAPPPTRVEVTLPEPLGERRLLDGGVSPPADPRPPTGTIDIDPIH